MSERRRWLAALLAIAWLALVFSAYYLTHKPLQLPQALALARILADLALVAVLATLAGGLGLRLLRLLRLDLPAGRCETLAWSAGLGLGVWALAMLLLGALGGLYPLPIVALLLLGVLLLRRDVMHWLRLLWSLRDRLLPTGRAEWVWRGYLLTLMALSLFLALLPPTAWDALVYHLTGPRLYLQAGQLVHPIDLPYLGFPQLGEMLFTTVLALRRPAATQLVSLLYGLLLMLGTYGVAARRWGRPAGSLAAALLFSGASLVAMLSQPYVDILLMFYALGALATLDRALDRPGGNNWFPVAGLLAAMATATKYTAIALPAGALLLILWQRGRRAWRPLLLFGLAWATFELPWLLKNWVLTANPVYPFIFDGLYWDDLRAWWYGRAGTGLAASAPWQIPLAPWFATVCGVEKGGPFDATIGPLFLALPPLLLLAWGTQTRARRRLLGRITLFAGPSLLLWLVGIASSAQLIQTRLLFPVFPLLAIVAAAAVEATRSLSWSRFKTGWVVRVLVALVLLLALLETALDFTRRRTLETALEIRPAEEYLLNELGWYQWAVKYLNQQLDPAARVLFLWEPRSFACQLDCRPDALLDRWWHLRQTYHDPLLIADHWQTQGVSHLLVHEAGLRFILGEKYDPLAPADAAALAQLLQERTTVVERFGDAYTLYRLESTP